MESAYLILIQQNILKNDIWGILQLFFFFRFLSHSGGKSQEISPVPAVFCPASVNAGAERVAWLRHLSAVFSFFSDQTMLRNGITPLNPCILVDAK